jgi:hypothetical protein
MTSKRIGRNGCMQVLTTAPSPPHRYDLEKDRTLAAHILKIHVQGTSTVREPAEGELDVLIATDDL